MSGGSYNYICYQIEELAETIRHQETDPRRLAFAKLMRLIGQAMHDIEWVDSCDYGPGDEHKAIDAVLAFLGSDPATIAKAQAFDAFKCRIKEFLDFDNPRSAEGEKR